MGGREREGGKQLGQLELDWSDRKNGQAQATGEPPGRMV